MKKKYFGDYSFNISDFQYKFEEIIFYTVNKKFSENKKQHTVHDLSNFMYVYLMSAVIVSLFCQ